MDTNANATTTDRRMTNLHEAIRQTIFSYNGEHVFCMLAQELDDVEPELAAVVRSAVASTNSPADSYEPSVDDRVRITDGADAGKVGEVLSVGMDEVEIELDAGSIVRVDPQVVALEVHDEHGVYLACSRCGGEVVEGEAEAHYRWCGTGGAA